MPSAWTFQDPKQVKKRGAEAASWYVGWFDPDGKKHCKSYGAGQAGKDKAEKRRIILEDQLSTGRYVADSPRSKWSEFRERFEADVLSRNAPQTRRLTVEALDDFERLCRPKKMCGVKTQTIDQFTTKRLKEDGRRKGESISPATVNRQLRHLKVAMRKAARWGYLSAAPCFDMLREPEKLVVYVTPEHFTAIYKTCDRARWPDKQNYAPADWWRALLVTGYMTGWRIGSLLAVRREDVDLDAGTAISRHGDNKGKRDVKINLHQVVIEHLEKLPGFSPFVFPWGHNERQLYDEFHAIQTAAGIKKPFYGFHDLRRAFATVNATRMTADALQGLMQHRSYTTTQKYINMATQLEDAVKTLYVPDVLRTGTGHGGTAEGQQVSGKSAVATSH